MNPGERVIERVLCQMNTVILRKITFLCTCRTILREITLTAM